MIPFKIDVICRYVVQSFSWEVDVIQMSSSAEHDDEKKIYGKSICRMPTHHELLMNFFHLNRTNELVMIISPQKEVMACITDTFYPHHGQGGPFTAFAMSFSFLWPTILASIIDHLSLHNDAYFINYILFILYHLQWYYVGQLLHAIFLKCYLSLSPSQSLEPEARTCIKMFVIICLHAVMIINAVRSEYRV